MLLCNWCYPAKQKGPLKLQEWQILKRVFNIYLTQNKPWDRRSIQRFRLRATVVTKMAHGYSESSTVCLCLSEWLGGTEGPKYPTHKGTRTHRCTPRLMWKGRKSGCQSSMCQCELTVQRAVTWTLNVWNFLARIRLCTTNQNTLTYNQIKRCPPIIVVSWIKLTFSAFYVLKIGIAPVIDAYVT